MYHVPALFFKKKSSGFLKFRPPPLPLGLSQHESGLVVPIICYVQRICLMLNNLFHTFNLKNGISEIF